MSRKLLAQHQPGGRGQHTVGTGDLLGELAERRGVDDTAPAAGGRRQRHRDAMPRRDCGDGASMTLSTVAASAALRRAAAEAAAADAAALTGAQRDLHRHMLGPAVTESPGLLDPFGDAAGRLPDGPSTCAADR